MLPAWILIVLSIEELALIVAFALKGQWIDVVYWTGVQVVNVALIWRALQK